MAVTGSELNRRVAELLDGMPADASPNDTWARQFDLGLAWLHAPEGRGGLGLDRDEHDDVRRRLRADGVPDPFPGNPIGHGMAAPTLLAHAQPELEDRLLRPLFTNEEIWCQLFSEPGAGSDLAGLATSATRDDDGWRISGQKVWTSLAHLARWGLLLARTDPAVPKHHGLTYFVVDLHAPGVTVRPLRQMTGDAEFNEVFLDDVHVPDAQRLGEVGAGWHVAMTTLANERSTLGDAAALGGGHRAVDRALDAWRTAEVGDAARRDRLASLWARTSALEALTDSLSLAGTLGPEGSIAKVVTTELNLACWDLTMDLLGSDSIRFDSAAGLQLDADGQPEPPWSFLRSRANTIEGGTTEVMLTIIGERLLGLPREPRLDREQPWRDVPRSG